MREEGERKVAFHSYLYNMKEREFINKYGIFSSIVVTIIGVGVFSYPRDLTELIGSDGWFVTLLGGFISWILLYLIYKVVKINNYNNFYGILHNNLGGILGKIFAVIFVAFNIFSIALGMRVFSEVIKMYLLLRTPTEFILMIMILTGVYLVRSGLDVLIRFNEISFWIMFIPIIFVLLAAAKGAEFTNVLPVFNNKFEDYIKAVGTTIYAFTGYQIAYLLIPSAKEKEKMPKIIFKSIVFVSVFYAVITIMALAIFSKKETSNLLWPTITMIKSIDIPGTFIERWEGVVMALWVIFYFTTFVNGYYFSSDIIKHAFKLEDIKISSLLIMPFIYLIALYPENVSELYQVSTKSNYTLANFALIILPIALLIISAIKQKRGCKDEV